MTPSLHAWRRRLRRAEKAYRFALLIGGDLKAARRAWNVAAGESMKLDE